jgi:glycosyltransferase involved in cell wall biosynthesis
MMDSSSQDAPLKILTNHWGQKISPAWKAVTTYVAPAGSDFLSSLKVAIRLYAMRTNYHCVVLGAGRSDTLFALLQSCLPFRRIPCVKIDCLWSRHPSPSRHLLKKITLKIVSRTLDRFVVWSAREIYSFSEAFDLPTDKFVFIPYHTTFVEYLDPVPTEGDYIFSGGNSERDYKTLIQAVRGLPVKLLIASTTPGIPPEVSIPDNVDLTGYTHEEYVRAMASCLLCIVPLAPGLLRSAGQQTFLNAMWLGKPTIVTDPEGAGDYISHGVDGLLVPPNDPVALRDAIVLLLNDPQKARMMGAKAREKARRYTTDEHFRRIISLVTDVVRGKRTYALTRAS